MSIRTYIDNNFFDHFLRWSQQDRELVSKSFRSYRHALYLSVEVFLEMAAIVNNPDKKDRLLDRSQFLFNILGNIRFLEYGGALVKGELNSGGSVSPFLPSGKAERLKGFITEMSRGLIQNHLREGLDDIAKRKDEDQKIFSEIKEELQLAAESKFGKVSTKNYDFEEFHVWVEKSIRETNARRFRNYPVGISGSRFLYTNAMTRSLAAMTYVNVFENRGVKKSDGFDIQHLVYLVDMDIFVCADDKMKRVCSLAFGKSPKALAPNDFLAEIKNNRSVRPSTSSGRTKPAIPAHPSTEPVLSLPEGSGRMESVGSVHGSTEPALSLSKGSP